MAERTQPRSFKELHSSVQTALRSKKAWAAFDSEELKKEALQYLEIMGTRNCVDVRNPSRGETNCDCFTTAIQNLSMTEAHCVGSALFDLLKKPRKQIDQDFLQWYLYADATRKALIGKPKKEQQRVFLLPGAWRYKICKNAIASFCGYGRDSYNRVVKAAEEGVVIPHGLVGRPTNRLLKHDHRPNFHSFFTKLEKFAAPRATRVVRCFNIGGNLENEMRDDDENLVELPPNMSKSSLYKRYCLEECNTIVKFNAKHKVIAKEPAVRGQEMLPCPAWSFFCDYWKENFAHLKIQKPRKDVCGECFKYANSMKTLSGHKRQLEEEGEEDLPTEYDAVLKCRRKEETHEESTRRMLELEREVEKASLHVKMAKEQRELFNLHKKAAAATRDSPKSERTATFVCDYAQNLYVPNFGDEQPGETYYYSPLNAYVFGMVDCSSNTLHAHLYMEGEGKKGDIIAPLLTIATVGPAASNVLLAAKTQAAVSAVTGFDTNRGFIDELHKPVSAKATKKPCQSRAFSNPVIDTRTVSQTTLTYCRFFGPLRSNLTSPSAFANKVWSRPIPTFVPAWKRVPRCRTMMLPATTA